jgi:hypothetical protein
MCCCGRHTNAAHQKERTPPSMPVAEVRDRIVKKSVTAVQGKVIEAKMNMIMNLSVALNSRNAQTHVMHKSFSLFSRFQLSENQKSKSKPI